MKKIIALVMAALMLLVSCSFALAEVPEGYPEIIEGLDFGGQTIWIYDWWSSDDENHSARTSEPDEETALTYAYRDWLEETYNCKIVETALSDWAGNPSELANMVMNGDNSKLCIVAVASDFAGTPLANDLYMPWQIDLSGEKWNKAASDFCTKDGKVYGVHVGKTEPRSCIFFNKRVLTEAGIDPESIYDAQADGTWTWDMMLDIMEKVQRDIDNDGIIDIWGFTGENITLQRNAVFGNGGSFFDFDDNGDLVITAGSDNTLEALAWAKDIWEKYAWKGGEGANWDFYKTDWKQNFCGFYMYQTYGGFNDNSEMADMADEWGCVAFPVPNEGDTYITVVSDNITMIPACYDEETVEKLAYIYDLWSNPTPGYDDEDSWIGNKYNYTDERAVDETYAMLREPEHCRINNVTYLGTQNDVLGSSLLWSLAGSTPAELIEAGMPAWQALCDEFNALER